MVEHARLVLNRQRLDLEMAKRGWTQHKLAQICECSQTQISFLFTGYQPVSARLVAKVAQAFGVPVEDLAAAEKPLKARAAVLQQRQREVHISDEPRERDGRV